ncbi:hypothetical protein [Sphaerisporangium sp. NPDC051011]|uniref:hypothetical protein n=1 Tax=Sphaerisporangium sp. NPDC051011 TaxID=3155792 RepID=UPI0033CA6782
MITSERIVGEHTETEIAGFLDRHVRNGEAEMTDFVVRTRDTAWIARRNGVVGDDGRVTVQVPAAEVERFPFAGRQWLRHYFGDCPKDAPSSWLVCAAALEDGQDVADVVEVVADPEVGVLIPGTKRRELGELLAAWDAAAGDPSGDGEHDAGHALAEAVRELLGRADFPDHSRR